MKAALHDGVSGMRVVEVARPQVEQDTVLVRVRAAGICGSDLNIYRRTTEPEKLPAGHEVAGEIAEIGPGVEGWSVGDHVAVETVGQGRACRRCRFCLAGQYRRCLNLAQGWGGGFAQFIKRKALGCYRLPDHLSWEEGALVEPLAVSVHGVRRGKMRGGETVVVLGAGTIGLTSVAAARAMGAGKVFATARHQHQAEMARRLGADATFSPEGPELKEAVADSTDGLGADLVFETVGGTTAATLQQAISVVRGLGRIVVLGGFYGTMELDLLTPLLEEQALIFSQCYAILDERHDFEIAIDILASGKLSLKEMVTHTFPLEEAQEAFRTAYDKTTGSIKVQLTP